MVDRRAWAIAIAILVGCRNDPTRIVVIADSDLPVPESIDGVRFVVDARDIGGDVVTREVDLTTTPLPLVLPVVHDGGPHGPVTIEAHALDGTAAIVSRAARLAFSPSRSIALHLVLSSSCAMRQCDASQTCVDGACAPIDVADGALPEWTGRDALTPITMGEPDASTPIGPMGDAGAGDAWTAPPADAGQCAAGCACRQTCDSACTCSEGCDCTLSCPGGGDCQDMRCDGADCRYEVRGASNVKGRCEHGARCTIDAVGVSNVLPFECRDTSRCDLDCSGTSNCELRCDGSASCLLRCDGEWGEDCVLACNGTQTRCADDLVVCNRACP
ncbi:hypothetical protein [Sandaracinus amylolyticus]|uniref:Uncharacterized protein n=1 Tax=Sandaracinus amylolyticus TaxID=927083 RepID=A0A0F6W4M1_9BACT|nr:hypothetical protein [Sandaracinus amylolyticus]AKF07202.1 hypothetical protein DB32_004351 [Sandaracinus amylolyticus]